MFTIVRIKGKQYKVSQGDTIEVSHMSGNVGDTVQFGEVLLMGDEQKTEVGTPFVRGASVSAKITDQGKGPKVTTARFKAKVRYRRRIGFRPLITKLEITSIGRA